MAPQAAHSGCTEPCMRRISATVVPCAAAVLQGLHLTVQNFPSTPVRLNTASGSHARQSTHHLAPTLRLSHDRHVGDLKRPPRKNQDSCSMPHERHSRGSLPRRRAAISAAASLQYGNTPGRSPGYGVKRSIEWAAPCRSHQLSSRCASLQGRHVEGAFPLAMPGWRISSISLRWWHHAHMYSLCGRRLRWGMLAPVSRPEPRTFPRRGAHLLLSLNRTTGTAIEFRNSSPKSRQLLARMPLCVFAIDSIPLCGMRRKFEPLTSKDRNYSTVAIVMKLDY